MRTHPIKQVITRVIELEESWEDGREVPVAREEVDCLVCFPFSPSDHSFPFTGGVEWIVTDRVLFPMP